MTRKELAEMLGISLRSLDNWEKEKPDLVRLINQGLALEDSIDETKRHLEKLEEIKREASNGKFKLK
jgi:transcriptional regulator with XRE-family HTH domain